MGFSVSSDPIDSKLLACFLPAQDHFLCDRSFHICISEVRVVHHFLHIWVWGFELLFGDRGVVLCKGYHVLAIIKLLNQLGDQIPCGPDPRFEFSKFPSRIRTDEYTIAE